MPISLIFAILFLVASIVTFLVAKQYNGRTKQLEAERVKQDRDQPARARTGQDFYTRPAPPQSSVASLRSAAGGLSIAWKVFGGLALLMLVLSSVAVVGTKKVGVVTSFNKPVGTLSNGLHFKAPWQKVTELDAAIQTDNHVGEEATKVRLANQSTADADVSVRWRLKSGVADDLYRDYRDFDRIRDSLVTRELKAALNEVFKDYDPLSTVKSDSGEKPPTLKELGDAVTTKLRERIGNEIEVLNVILPLIQFDGATQQRIDAYQAEIAETRIAQQREQTSIATARANEKLASSVSKDPNVLVSRCIDVLSDVVKSGKNLPAGFSCWPGSGVSAAVPVK